MLLYDLGTLRKQAPAAVALQRVEQQQLEAAAAALPLRAQGVVDDGGAWDGAAAAAAAAAAAPCNQERTVCESDPSPRPISDQLTALCE